jgi:hypothetical protein
LGDPAMEAQTSLKELQSDTDSCITGYAEDAQRHRGALEMQLLAMESSQRDQLTIMIISPFALLSSFFSIPDQVLPCLERTPTSFVTSVVAMIVLLSILLGLGRDLDAMRHLLRLLVRRGCVVLKKPRQAKQVNPAVTSLGLDSGTSLQDVIGMPTEGVRSGGRRRRTLTSASI